MIYQVEREKLAHEERMCRSESEKSNMNSSLGRLEEENVDLQRQVQCLQAQLSELESQHAQRYNNPRVDTLRNAPIDTQCYTLRNASVVMMMYEQTILRILIVKYN